MNMQLNAWMNCLVLISFVWNEQSVGGSIIKKSYVYRNHIIRNDYSKSFLPGIFSEFNIKNENFLKLKICSYFIFLVLMSHFQLVSNAVTATDFLNIAALQRGFVICSLILLFAFDASPVALKQSRVICTSDIVFCCPVQSGCELIHCPQAFDLANSRPQPNISCNVFFSCVKIHSIPTFPISCPISIDFSTVPPFYSGMKSCVFMSKPLSSSRAANDQILVFLTKIQQLFALICDMAKEFLMRLFSNARWLFDLPLSVILADVKHDIYLCIVLSVLAEEALVGANDNADLNKDNNTTVSDVALSDKL
ncbi:hypothetical protein EGR_05384 [Echinococcus granulosus]|uniref:Uncharacterized protein n=1 Tax=Echinococcus granulosus TaxID=6210 RepID=W6V1L7_ECHGR|nr:hypothetical protein EGR_05384 [Echinococcus granulosus]EUB59764.1 hypothetical protein EGR_05384 [Echinococcus granulosus]